MHEYFYLEQDDQHALLFSENAFYYSFYNDAVQASSLAQAFELLVHDNRSEYGHEINAIQRFNIFPELLFAMLYRCGNALSNGLLAASISAMTFYLCGVSLVFGVGVVAFLRLSRILSAYSPPTSNSSSSSSSSTATTTTTTNSREIAFLTSTFFNGWFAGLVTVLLAAINYHYVTRIQLHPPLRENFGVPCFLLQLAALAKVLLRSNDSSYATSTTMATIELFLTTTMFLLVWQFAHFLLFLEVRRKKKLVLLFHVSFTIPIVVCRGVCLLSAAGVAARRDAIDARAGARTGDVCRAVVWRRANVLVQIAVRQHVVESGAVLSLVDGDDDAKSTRQ
jgi:hypothetical protein